MDYMTFLQTKIDVAEESGFAVSPDAVNLALKPHQRDAVVWAIRGGIMTVPTLAVKHGRKGIGVELNPDYFRDGVAYLREADEQIAAPTLLDLLGYA